MPANFLSLPSELRNDIYEQALVLQEPFACLGRFTTLLQPLGLTPGHGLTPALLRVNKAVHLEASSILYAQNRFDFTLCTALDVLSFLEQIGHSNTSHILHIRVIFPSFFFLALHHVGHYEVALNNDDRVRMLAQIRDYCTNLRTLTTSRPSTESVEARLAGLDAKSVAEAMAMVDARFRAISSLQEIVVEVYGDGRRNHMRREMENLGWTISATEYGGFDYYIELP